MGPLLRRFWDVAFAIAWLPRDAEVKQRDNDRGASCHSGIASNYFGTLAEAQGCFSSEALLRHIWDNRRGTATGK